MSTIKVNSIEPVSGTDITIPTGKNLVITDGLDANTITSGTLADARIPANALNSNVDLGNLSATNLTSGTLPDARFPATLPAVSGANLTNLPVDLTNLNATNLTSGTVPDARFPSVLPAVSGANLTNLPGGGGMIPLASSTWSSNVSSVDFTNVISSTYNSYKVFVANLLPTAYCDVRVQYLDASNNPVTGSYTALHMMVRFQSFGGPALEMDSHGGAGFKMNGYGDTDYNEVNGDMSFELTINDPTRSFGGTNKMSYGFGQCGYRNGSVGQQVVSTITTRTTKFTTNNGGFKIYPSTGSLARGFAVVYGYNS